RHRDEKLTGLAVFVQTDSDVTFMSSDLEPMGERSARVGHAMPDRLIKSVAQRCQLFFQFENALLEFAGPDRDIEAGITWAGITDPGYSTHVFCLACVWRRGSFGAIPINRDRFQSQSQPF